jgi:hypothetical protein
MKTVHSFDYANGRYLGPLILTEADLSPLEEGVFLLPGNCVELAPPVTSDQQVPLWNRSEWLVVDLPKAGEAEPEREKTAEELNAEAIAMRANAYRAESDPLFFKYQRGEATKEEWLASIEDIKARYPKA